MRASQAAQRVIWRVGIGARDLDRESIPVQIFVLRPFARGLTKGASSANFWTISSAIVSAKFIKRSFEPPYELEPATSVALRVGVAVFGEHKARLTTAGATSLMDTLKQWAEARAIEDVKFDIEAGDFALRLCRIVKFTEHVVFVVSFAANERTVRR